VPSPNHSLEQLVDEKALASAQCRALGQLNQCDRSILGDSALALTTYLSLIHGSSRSASYRDIPNEVRRICGVLLERGGRPLLDTYHRAVLLTFIERRDQFSSRLPSSIRVVQNREFNRIVRETEVNGEGYYDLSRDSFLKDLALSAQRLIPAGAQLFERWSAVPRSILFCGGLKQSVQSFRLFILRHRSFGSLLQLHTSEKNLEEFTPEGRNRVYGRVSDYLELNPDVRGMFGMSWLFDPVLESISPRLCYLRQIPIGGGAAVFRMGPADAATRDATAKSETRRRLHETGRYVPTNYILIWPRRALIAWTRARRREGAEI